MQKYRNLILIAAIIGILILVFELPNLTYFLLPVAIILIVVLVYSYQNALKTIDVKKIQLRQPKAETPPSSYKSDTLVDFAEDQLNKVQNGQSKTN